MYLTRILLLILFFFLLPVGGNRLETLPSELGQLSLLEELAVFDNNIKGTIPQSIGLLANLQSLATYTNKDLSGTVPLVLGNLIKLRYLWLFGCSLT